MGHSLPDDIFFVLSKIVWGLVRADSVLALLMAAALWALWSGRPELGRALVTAAALGWGAIVLSPLANTMLRGIESRHPVPQIAGPVAGIVVLGGAEDPVGTLAWGPPSLNEGGERFFAALELARLYPDAPVMFTGGSGRLKRADLPEAEVARRVLTSAGLDPARLILEGASRNTAENARLGRALAPARAGRWLLVTSAFHMPRAVETFCAAGWTGLVPYPVDFRSHPGLGLRWAPAESIQTFNLALHEYLGLAVYRATGRAVRPLPEACLARP
ncbi:YdcF family protein [Rhodovulum euryhalinum]|uniref:Uncharacterized SAM-binding protein YcdF (DUF218 family) n=1 Tax=Rhodovulum euryhalinum TaxID=35805 RepID=A0A4R2KT07_9RHOB|nr:YdcF family protein [Rhodovulum euryhalinum]TCO74196.1 uncharacterized SAM-binding protein YcdF (DUF218 family) [Rhodovulum euryhalinum]